MIYQKEISQEDQLNWFRNVDPDRNFYLMISTHGKDVGVCNMKNVNWEDQTGEGGIFIGDFKYLNTSVPVKAILNAATYFCDVLQIERVNISIVEGNAQAVHFNQMLGAVETNRGKGLIQMYFTRAMLHAATSKLIQDIGERYKDELRKLIVQPESDIDLELLSSCAGKQTKSNQQRITILN